MDADAKFRRIIARILAKTEKNVGQHACIVWQGATTNKNKNPVYGKVRNPFNTGPTQTQVHRLLYMAQNRLEELQHTGRGGEKMEVSHLCHNSLCVNIDHLVFESHEKNMERVHCKRQGSCTRNHMPNCLL